MTEYLSSSLALSQAFGVSALIPTGLRTSLDILETSLGCQNTATGLPAAQRDKVRHDKIKTIDFFIIFLVISNLS
jgi:hypothetical protein